VLIHIFQGFYCKYFLYYMESEFSKWNWLRPPEDGVTTLTVCYIDVQTVGW
jgi:hypothetical protein